MGGLDTKFAIIWFAVHVSGVMFLCRFMQVKTRDCRLAAWFSSSLMYLNVKLRWFYTRRFATTILSATQRCNVGTMLQPFDAMWQQCCNAVVHCKLSLRNVPWNITFTQPQYTIIIWTKETKIETLLTAIFSVPVDSPCIHSSANLLWPGLHIGNVFTSWPFQTERYTYWCTTGSPVSTLYLYL